MTALSIDMPLPPSANRLFKNLPQGGRARTREYDAWIEEAGYAVEMAWRAAGRPTIAAPLSIGLDVGLIARKRDVGNTLKAVEDLLVKRIPGLPDDKFNDLIVIRRGGDAPEGMARVTVSTLGPPG
ncbi:hypothetical protein ACBY01_07115 [Sphingomonas sp. ac-8]|uniref:hypothetical protein n=1 Tax=Sphingomonas sp. ac-8 TaxID=3242977 RepID=UPI003A80DFEF